MKEEVEDFTHPEVIPTEERRKLIMVERKDRNDGGKATTFIEIENIKTVSYTHLTLPTKRIV